MEKLEKNGPAPDSNSFERLGRSVSSVAQVEHALRDAIREDRFPDGKLPPEVELAEQLGVGRETVRLAAEVLQREGLLFKIRRRGTFTKSPLDPREIKSINTKLFGYLQADFMEINRQEELTVEGARKLVDRFLGMAPRPTALYCFNNTLANLAMKEFKRRKVRVPNEVSVMGAGGEEVPNLTCHQVDWNLMGRTAVQILIRALVDPERHETEHHLFSHAMRLGKTTAKPIDRNS